MKGSQEWIGGAEYQGLKWVCQQATCNLIRPVAQRLLPLAKPYIKEMLRQSRSHLDQGILYKGVPFKMVGSALSSDHDLMQAAVGTFEDALVEALLAPNDWQGDLVRGALMSDGYQVLDTQTGKVRVGHAVEDSDSVNDIRSKLQNVKFSNDTDPDGLARAIVDCRNELKELSLTKEYKEKVITEDIDSPLSQRTAPSTPPPKDPSKPPPKTPSKPPPPMVSPPSVRDVPAHPQNGIFAQGKYKQSAYELNAQGQLLRPPVIDPPPNLPLIDRVKFLHLVSCNALVLPFLFVKGLKCVVFD